MWDNFSSETYKNLPAVGEVHFFNPFSGKPVDSWGNNDTYAPPAGGPGYYRPASLISLWATAPFIHNNTLGEYTHDPSIQGRLKAFDDGIDKILWTAKREASPVRLPGDLRGKMALADGDRGFIFRTTEVSFLDIPAPFIKQLITGVAGPSLTSLLTTWLWYGLAVVALVLAIAGRARHAGFFFAVVGVLVAVLLRVSGVDSIYPALWLVPAVAAVAAVLLWLVPRKNRWIGRVVFLVLGGLAVLASMTANASVDGKMGPIEIGPIPKGTPVNLMMNLNPEASTGDLINAAFGVTRGILRIRKDSLGDGPAWQAFEEEAAVALMRVSKCPDFVLDRGHWFAEALPDEEKKELKAFLKTL
jgi:hypothetical protein